MAPTTKKAAPAARKVSAHPPFLQMIQVSRRCHWHIAIHSNLGILGVSAGPRDGLWTCKRWMGVFRD